MEAFNHLMMARISVVYQLVVQILTLASSLLIYSVSSFYFTGDHAVLFIVGWVQIEDISVDLPSDITVLPQTYTLHAVKIGTPNPYIRSANWYYESGNTSTELCTISSDNRDVYHCNFGYGMSVDKGNGRRDFTLTITWNEENIASGIFNQAKSNGDHKYKFYLHVSNVMRNRTITITGRLFKNNVTVDYNYTFITKPQLLLPLLYMRSTRQLPLSLSAGLRLIHLMLMVM